MSLLPTYDPKSFASVDLRKYHIRDIQDVIKFHEFVASRMEESQFILKKFNTQMATFKAVTAQLKKKQEQQQATYGAPSQQPAQQNTVGVQHVEDKSLEKQHEELLNDIKQAAAEEKLASDLKESSSDDPASAILGKYKIIYGKKGPMYYRENEEGKVRLVSKFDVPEDIKQQLLSLVGKEE